MCLQDAVPWAFPRNFRAPPLQSSRRQRLLSFLRGASPQRSSLAAAARSSSTATASGMGQQRLTPGAPAECHNGSAAPGSAAAGSTQSVAFGQLSAPTEAPVEQQANTHSTSGHQPPAVMGVAPAAFVSTSPRQQLLPPPHEASSDPQPEGLVPQRIKLGNGTSGGGGGWSEGAQSQTAARHLDHIAVQPQPQRLQQAQQLITRNVSLASCAADGGTVGAPPLPNGLTASSGGHWGGRGGSVSNSAVSSNGSIGGTAPDVHAADTGTAGSLRAAFSGGSLQPPAGSLLAAQSSLPSEEASGENTMPSSALCCCRKMKC
jgi:hypothetical protein